MPQYRSQDIGKRLIKEIVGPARNKTWKRVELCMPPEPEFDRTVAFYQSNGFKISGGYKMNMELYSEVLLRQVYLLALEISPCY